MLPFDIVIGTNSCIGTCDQTGAVVAMLEYPSPSATNMSAVVPNASATNIYPTLGSAGVPWPQSYSVGHYFFQNSGDSPPFPGGLWTGWVIYTAPSSGYLVAYKGSGRPTVLAS
jgi:hypothetical protein